MKKEKVIEEMYLLDGSKLLTTVSKIASLTFFTKDP